MLRLKENMKEHRTLKTLINIPLRSMLINAGRDTVKDSQQYRSGTSFKIASTWSRKETTLDFIFTRLLSSC